MSVGFGGLMLAVFWPHNHTNRSLPVRGLMILPWHAGQSGLLKMLIFVKYISLKSQIISFPLRFSPIPASSFTVSMACIVPMIPAVVPSTPRVWQVGSWSSFRPGSIHSRQGVSGGEKTERFPSIPMAAPKTYGILCFTQVRFTRYRVLILSKPSTTQSIPLTTSSTLSSPTFIGKGSIFKVGLVCCILCAAASTLGYRRLPIPYNTCLCKLFSSTVSWSTRRR